MVTLEIGLITPPMGINLFFMRNTFGISMSDLLRGTAPFLVAVFLFLIVILFVPQLSLWLPRLMSS